MLKNQKKKKRNVYKKGYIRTYGSAPSTIVTLPYETKEIQGYFLVFTKRLLNIYDYYITKRED
uniref:Uncharacterized protein n=1 Tax=Glossina pallidipes TaxID=7398 RepID=A0A1B0AG84_GLOPL